MDPQILIRLTKIISEQNENPVRIEKNLVQKNPDKDKTGSKTVQLGSTYLTIHRPKNPQWSEAQQQRFFDQLEEMEQQKKLFFQICETKKPLMVLKSEISKDALNQIRGGDLGKSGPGPRAKADAARNARKTGGGSPFVQSFTPQRQYCSRQTNKPLSCRTNVKINEQQFNGNQNPGGASSSMETMSKRLSQEYREYQQKFNSPPLSKRFDTKKYDEKNFKGLAKDPKAKKEVFHKTTVDEARTAIYAEIEGIVDNPQRIEQPICKSVDLDFEIDGPAPFTHMDTKHPVGSEILVKQNSPDTLQEMAYNMGKSLVKQKERFCGLEQGPESSENVLHIIDMAYVPSHEKEIVKEYCLKGAKETGSSEGIKFLNDK